MRFETPITTETIPIVDSSASDAQRRILATSTALLGIDDRTNIYEVLEEQVGNTGYDKISLDGVKIVSKREFDNPSGSHYDRTYVRTIRQLEEAGWIEPNTMLYDISSGSAGISLAFIGGLLGYRVNLRVPTELPETRVEPMRIFGANEIIRSKPGYIAQASNEQRDDIRLRIRSGWKRVKIDDPLLRGVVLLEKDKERVCFINHSENLLSPVAFQSIAEEIVRDNEERFDTVVLAIGNWTTIAGIVPVLRQSWPDTKIVGYEDSRNAPTLASLNPHSSFIFGAHDSYGTSSYGVPVKFQNIDLLDDLQTVTPEQRELMNNLYNSGRSPTERIGNSSLMGLVVAQRAIGTNVLTLFYDQKLRY